MKERWTLGSSWKYSVTCISSWPLDDCLFEWRSKLPMSERPFFFFQFSFPYLLYLLSFLLIYVIFCVVLFSCFINSSFCSPSPDIPPTLLCLAASLFMLRFRQFCWTLSEDQFRSWFGVYGICCRAVGSGSDFPQSTSVYPCQHHPINASYSVILLSPAVWS